MSYPAANVNIATDTFAVWVTRTNTLLNALSNYIVTVDNSPGGNTTYGSGYVYGTLGADYISVGTKLRGGNVATNSNLTVESNTTFERNVTINGNTSVTNLLITGNTNIGNVSIVGDANLANVYAVNITTGNLAVTSNSSMVNLTVSGNANLNNMQATGNVSISKLLANGAIGTNGQVLTSNGTTVYWNDSTSGGTVTNIVASNGLFGGTITTTGTIGVRANTGLVSNTSGLFVNSTFIAQTTVNTANNANNLGGVSATSYQLNSTLAANVAQLTSNNALYLGGQPQSYYTNATNLSTGTVDTARLATGTANSSTYLRGDQTWAPVSGGGGGTVTSIATGTGLTGGTITTTGTISLNNTAVTTGTYGNSTFIPQITVDAQGRLTSATTVAVQSGGAGTVTSITGGNGLAGGTITGAGTLSVLGNTGITVGATGVSLATAGAGAASYSSGISAITVDAYGRVTSVTGSAGYVTSSGVTSLTAGNGLAGGTITSTGTVSVLGNTGITVGSTGVSLATAGAGAATYSGGISAMTVDAYGRVTSVTGSGGGFATGTAMLFVQTSAPTGWTKSTTHNNKALRVVSGAASSGGTVAFTTAFGSQSVSGTIGSTTATGSLSSNTATGSLDSVAAGGTVGSTTLTSSQIASHYHAATTQTGFNIPGSGGAPPYYLGTNDQTGNPTAPYNLSNDAAITSSAGSSGSHTHSFTGTSHTHTFTGTAHSHTFTGTSHNHTFTGTAIDLAVQYVDVIIATKD